MGYAYLHTALDDHSRLAYTEDLPDETAATWHGLPHPSRGLVRRPRRHVERILTDNACNAWTYTKNTWRQTCHELGISPHWTLPWRPQTNGKTHPFHRALIEEWAYRRPYTSDAERQTALTEWIDWSVNCTIWLTWSPRGPCLVSMLGCTTLLRFIEL